MRTAIINLNSKLCTGVFNSPDSYRDGVVIDNNLYVDISDVELSDNLLLNSYYKNNEFKQLPTKPSQHHIWNLALEQWEEPEGYLQTIQSDGSKQINQAASQKILSKYPIYKQLNLARTEEAQVMYSWIDNIRNLSNIANANIEASTTLEQINSIVENFKTELGNIA